MSGAWRIREAATKDAASIARVHIDTWLTTYRGIVPDAFLDRLARPEAYEKRTAKWVDLLAGKTVESAGFTMVALDVRGEIVGFSGGGPERGGDPDYRGELYAMYIKASQQGKGLGRLLARETIRRLSAMGFRSMLVWVLKENPACRFYEAMGGVPVRARKIDFSGAALEEIGYGWKTLPSP